MNTLEEIPKDQLEHFKINVKEWLDLDNQIKELDQNNENLLKQLTYIKIVDLHKHFFLKIGRKSISTIIPGSPGPPEFKQKSSKYHKITKE